MSGFDFIDVGDLAGEGPGGMVRKTRRALGAHAFGFNYFVLPPNQGGREHDHTDSNQEEVYFIVSGSGTMRIQILLTFDHYTPKLGSRHWSWIF